MNVARPHAAVSPSLDGEVLVVLAGTVRQLTGREVARLVKLGSQAGVSRSLRRLVEQGIVLAQPAGTANLYSLNREHLAAPAVQSLAGLRSELLRRLKDAFARWKTPPLHASLFGSAARGDGDASSDIDLFLVRPSGVDEEDRRWRKQLDEVVEQVRRWTGNHVGLSEVSKADLQRLRKTRPKITDELLADAVALYGPAVSSLLRSRK
jgi:predicted nucleotidyltransferase